MIFAILYAYLHAVFILSNVIIFMIDTAINTLINAAHNCGAQGHFKIFEMFYFKLHILTTRYTTQRALCYTFMRDTVSEKYVIMFRSIFPIIPILHVFIHIQQ